MGGIKMREPEEGNGDFYLCCGHFPIESVEIDTVTGSPIYKACCYICKTEEKDPSRQHLIEKWGKSHR